MESRSGAAVLPSHGAGVLAPAYRALTLGMVALIALFAFEALAVATAMPSAAQELHALPLYALAFGSTLAASVVGTVVSGSWCDARGPAPPLWHGTAWFVAGVLLAGLAPTMGVLLAGRLAQGFGSGLLAVALYVLVGQIYPAALRPRVFAAFSSAWVLPALVGPALAGLIVETWGWRWVFLAVPVVALPAALALRAGLRRAPIPHAAAQDGWQWPRIAAAGGAALAAAGLHLGGQQANALGLGTIVLCLAALPLCLRQLVPAGTLRAAPGLPAVILLRGLAGAAFFGAEAFVPLALAHQRGLSPLQAGGALTAGALCWSLGSWYRGHHARAAPAASLRLGLILVGVGAALPALLRWPATPLWTAIAGWAVAGFGMGLVYPVLAVLSLELAAPGEQGRSSSALQLVDSLGTATALSVSGSLFAFLLTRSAPLAFAACFGLSVLTALAAALLAWRVVPR